MSRIIPLEVEFSPSGTKNFIHPVVLADENSVVLVDCGYTGSLDLIEAQLALHGISLGQLTHLLLTHQDHDHIGAAAALKQRVPSLQVLASRKEAPYISGKKKPLRLAQAELLQPHLPPEQQATGKAFMQRIKEVQPVEVDMLVSGSERFAWCGGCEVIATPGHTPGHIALFVSRYKTLIAGDAATITEGRLAGANPQYTLDKAEAARSLKAILQLQPSTVICYHGGIWKNSGLPAGAPTTGSI